MIEEQTEENGETPEQGDESGSEPVEPDAATEVEAPEEQGGAGEPEAPAEETSGDTEDTAEAPVEGEEREAQAGDEPEDQPAAPSPSQRRESSAATGDEVVPGAELEPITLEGEQQLDAEERARLEAEEEERRRLESALTEDEPEEEPVARPVAEIAKDARYAATGKRKRSVARVVLSPGGGEITINGRTLHDYFPRNTHQTTVRQPLVTAGYADNVDVRIRVHGGGASGQAGAARHGIARALTEIDAELRPELKRRGLLTRDARIKERRKAGLKKARKRPQFSKR